MKVVLFTKKRCRDLFQSLDDIDSALAKEEKQKLKMRACRQLAHIEQLFQKQLDQWLEGSDEVFVFLSNIVIQKRRLELFLKSVRDLDVPLIERLYVDMLPIWEATGSNKYVRLTLDLIETLYKKISFSQLQELRINKCIRLYTQRSTEISEDCGTAMDAIAELVNKRLKQGKQAKDITGWNKQSELVGLTWRCVNFTDRNYTAKDHGEDIDDDYSGCDVRPKDSVIPKLTIEKIAVNLLLCWLSWG